MTEKDYIMVSNLTKLRTITSIISELLPYDGGLHQGDIQDLYRKAYQLEHEESLRMGDLEVDEEETP